MRTFKSPRGRWTRYNTTLGAHARRSAAREAASIAGPSPEYPPLAPLHGDWLGACVNGQTVIMRLARDSKHRSDQWAAEIDGETVADAAGLVVLLNLLRGQFAKAPSKRMLGSMQNGFSARDEEDARAADAEMRTP
jgi:hypothetical protein